MIYILPTKRGMGVELWGTNDDIYHLYEVVTKFWNDEKKTLFKGYDNRNKLISSFSYEIRKTYEGSRLLRENSHFSDEQVKHYGFQISWVHILFSLTALKSNMSMCETTKLDIAIFLQIDFWLEKAMLSYDEVGGRDLSKFIDNGLYGGNEFIYHYMRSINLDYYLLGGGKKSFRKLPRLLRRGIFFTDEYNSYKKHLETEAKRYNCTIHELELDDNDVDYEKIKW